MAVNFRSRYVEWCLSQVGSGPTEQMFSACGLKPMRYYTGIQWCGIFALAGLVISELCAWPWVIGSGFVGAHVGNGLRKTTLALAKGGDLAVQNRSPWHHCVLRARTSNGWLVINGNSKGGVVTETESVLANYTIYSIQQLVDDAEALAPTIPPPAKEIPKPVLDALDALRRALQAWANSK